jgi:hypothetical protein
MAEGWEPVAEVETEDEARLMAGFLGAAGIGTEVESVASHEFPVTHGDLALVRVWVPAERLEEARGLLAEREGAAAADVLPEGEVVEGAADGSVVEGAGGEDGTTERG